MAQKKPTQLQLAQRRMYQDLGNVERFKGLANLLHSYGLNFSAVVCDRHIDMLRVKIRERYALVKAVYPPKREQRKQKKQGEGK